MIERRSSEKRKVFPEGAHVGVFRREPVIVIEPGTWVNVGLLFDSAGLEDALNSHTLSKRDLPQNKELPKKKAA
jgi:hypothetical protein